MGNKQQNQNPQFNNEADRGKSKENFTQQEPGNTGSVPSGNQPAPTTEQGMPLPPQPKEER